jgi:N-carbamoyl-L-amino-acid hydrolase
MIFVPSVGGVSHDPRETTAWEDVVNGANVLLGTVLELARREDHRHSRRVAESIR